LLDAASGHCSMLAGGWPVNCRLTEINLTYQHKLLCRVGSSRVCRLVKHSRRCRITSRVRSAATDHHTFYSVLGVSRDATLAEVKTAYRRLAIKWHPDHASGAEARETYQVRRRVASREHSQTSLTCLTLLQAIKDAYDVLSNHTKRHHYNKHGIDGLGSHFHRYEATHGQSGSSSLSLRQTMNARNIHTCSM